MRSLSCCFLACALLAVSDPAAAGDSTLSRFEFSEVHMGTRFQIVLYAPDAAAANRASHAAFERVAALDNIMSDYRDGSELMRLSARAGGPPVKISEDLFRVLSKAQRVSEASDGAFDITVGPVVRLWRRARRQHELPAQEEIAAALELTGYKNLQLDAPARTAELLKPGMALDLGGIAKGDAADQALALLKRYGIESALVAAAGDIAAGSPPPGEMGWKIGVSSLPGPNLAKNKPRITNQKSKIENEKPPMRYVMLRDAGISTSGDAEQHVEIAGVRYSHIVNPRTGMALTGRSSVTVMAPDGISADSFATAASVLGPERARKLVKSTPRTSLLFVRQTAQWVETVKVRFPR